MEERRLKTVAKLRYGDALPKEKRSSGTTPVMGSNGQVGLHAEANTSGKTIVVGRKGSFGKVRFVPSSAFVIDTAYFIDSRSTSCDLRWLYYVLTSIGLDTITRDTGVPGLSRELAHNAMVPVCNPADEVLISRYLDNAELRIARAIQARSEVAMLLREARSTMINELVLKGEVRGAPTVDSGIPGIDRIPGDWNLMRAKYVWSPTNVRSRAGDEERLSVSSVSGVVPRSWKKVTMFEASSYVGHKVVEPGNLVINSLWAWATGLGVSQHHGIVSPVYGVFELRPEARSDLVYLDYLLRSNAMQWQFRVHSKGIWKSRLQLSDDAFFRMVLPLPPLSEQRAIAQEIAARTSDLDKAVAAAELEISLLREYRIRLIADVVTGKKDVRAEAASLPDVDPLELASVLSGVVSSEDEEVEDSDGD